MKQLLIFIISLFLAQGIMLSQQTICDAAKEDYYQNPIISGFHPDPSICRVEDDYYLITSTFEYFPGVPVFHSKDLVNWKIIGHVLSRPEQINLDSAQCSKGIFAPTIRYYDGTFYMITTDVNGGGNFICTATDPAGPWSDPHWIEDAPGIDPSLFFDDDGKVYYTGNCHPETHVFPKDRNIWTQELDTKTWKLVGDKINVVMAADYYNGLILSGQENTSLNNFEGPHLYKKDGFYYVMLSHGGTSWNHAVSIWRSENVFGPYEMNPNNPILTHRDFPANHQIHCTGHADVVHTQNNEWWMVLLATRPYGKDQAYNLGRETFLVPVEWEGAWPVVNPLGPKGRVLPTHQKPNLPTHEWAKVEARDDFDSESLGLDWNFIRTPRGQWWDLDTRKDKLNLKLIPNELSNNKLNPAFIGRRQQHKNFVASTKMDFTPEASNETAGLVILRDNNYHYRLVSTIDNGNHVLQLIKRAVKIGGEEVIKQVTIQSSIVYMKVEALEQMYAFSYSLDGKDWDVLVADENGQMLSRRWAGGYTGIYIGMYASSNGKESRNTASFDWFEYLGY